MINCMDQTIPTMSSINEEYKNIAKEDDQKEDKNILQEMLKTQISSVNAIKESEEITNKDIADICGYEQHYCSKIFQKYANMNI